ncbi:MAG TPA: hypothetical protein VG125_20940 [Pirellulales bacterium]|jgi:hypothetical protein|nr:hypothetical protein [Pirellulales bacterium]
MARPFQFSLRVALSLVFAIALAVWPSSIWLRTYLANRGLVPVKGRVTFKGQPLQDAQVILVPAASEAKPVQGVTNAMGVYEMETLATPGDYAVTIMGPASRPVPSKYTSAAKSGIVVTVIATGENHLDFELTD